MCRDNKKRVLILGGHGLIGTLLREGLSELYEVLISDVSCPDNLPDTYLNIDIRDYDNLFSRIPNKIDVLINLSGLPASPAFVNESNLTNLSDVYIRGSYNVFLAAHRLKIPRVIFASTNHVTGMYESGGTSLIDRQISVSDLPNPDSVYGAMKHCAELFGQLFATQKGLSVISLRLGTVRSNEAKFLKENARARHTILSQKDTVSLFLSAIEAELQYGIFYGVSDNPERPWDIEDAISKLNFKPAVNSVDLLSGIDVSG